MKGSIYRKGKHIAKRWLEGAESEIVERRESADFKSINAAKRESRRLQAAGWQFDHSLASAKP